MNSKFNFMNNPRRMSVNSVHKASRVGQDVITLDLFLPDQIDLIQWISFSDCYETDDAYYGTLDGEEGQVEVIVDYPGVVAASGRNESSIIDVALSLEIDGAITSFYAYTSSGMFICDETSCVNGRIIIPIKDIYEQASCVDILIFPSTSLNVTSTISINSSRFDFTVEHSLSGLVISRMPTKMHYLEGEAFNPLGMAIDAVYSDGSTESVRDYTLANNSPVVRDADVIVSHGNCSCRIPVDVFPLSEIENSGYRSADLFNVNLLTGRLLLPFETVDIGGNSYNMSVPLIYDSGMKGVQRAMFWGCGNGFKLSADQRVLEVDEETIEYVDDVGFAHEYRKYSASGMFYDIDDARNTIRITTDGFELVDGVGNKILFDSDGMSISFQSNVNQSINKRIVRNRFGQIVLVYDERCDDGRLKRECIVLEYDGNGMLSHIRSEKDGHSTLARADLNYDNDGFLISVSYFNSLNGLLRQSHDVVYEYCQGTLSKMVNCHTKEVCSFTYNNGKVITIRSGHIGDNNEIIAEDEHGVDYSHSSEYRTRVTDLNGITFEYQLDREGRVSSVFEVDPSGNLHAVKKWRGIGMCSLSDATLSDVSLNDDETFWGNSRGFVIDYPFSSFVPSFVQDFTLSMSVMIGDGCSDRLNLEALYGGLCTRVRINPYAVNVWQAVRIPIRFATGNQKRTTNSVTIRLMSDSNASHRFLFSRPYLSEGDLDNLCIDVNGTRMTDSSGLLLQENGIVATADNGRVIRPALTENDVLYNVIHRQDVIDRGLLSDGGRVRIKGITSLCPTGGDNLLSNVWNTTSVYIERRGLRIRKGTLSRKVIQPDQIHPEATRIDDVSYSLDEFGRTQDELNRKYFITTADGICIEEGDSEYLVSHTYTAYGTRISSCVTYGNDCWEVMRAEVDRDGEFLLSLYEFGSGSRTFEYSNGTISTEYKSSYSNETFFLSGPSKRFVYDEHNNLSSIVFSFVGEVECCNQIEYQGSLISKYSSPHYGLIFSTEWQERSSVTSVSLEAGAPFMILSKSHNSSRSILLYSDNLQDVIERTYDSYGRVIRENLNGIEMVSYVYAGANGFSETTSQVTAIHDGYEDVTRNFEYDQSGNLVKESVGTRFSSVTYGEKSVTESNNISCGTTTLTEYSKDKIEKVTFREYDTSRLLEINTYSYDWMGRIASKSGNVSATFEYDGPSVCPSKIIYTIMANDYVQQMRYDDESRAVEVTIDNETTTYLYDDFGRLSEENTGGVITRFEYNGDCLSSISTGVSRVDFAHDQNGRMTSAVHRFGENVVSAISYTYDDIGEMVSRIKDGVSVSMSWSRGLMARYGTLVFEYDYLGRRIKKGTTSFYYSLSGRLIAQVNGSVTLRFLYDETGPCGFVDQRGLYRRYIKNWRGDVIAIAGLDGIEARYRYCAFGKCEVLNPDGTSCTDASFIGNINPIRYCGYYYDVETGLYWLSSRYYDPEIGRFISPDSVDYLDPTRINGLNLYAYCNNDPVNYCDPSGHSAILIGLLIGAIIGIAAGVGYAAYTDYSDDNSINGSVGAEAYLGYGLLGGVIGGALGAGIGYIWPALSTFAASSFTFGGGISMSGGAVVLSSGITITGAQILEGAGVLAGLGIMYMIPKHGTPNTKITDGGSFGEYDSNGNLSYRVDTTGRSHYIKSIGKYCLPHKHQFTWKLINGVWRFIEEVLPYIL